MAAASEVVVMKSWMLLALEEPVLVDLESEVLGWEMMARLVMVDVVMVIGRVEWETGLLVVQGMAAVDWAGAVMVVLEGLGWAETGMLHRQEMGV